MFPFMLAYGQVSISLSNILGMRYFPESPDNVTAIGLTLQAIMDYHNFGDMHKRDVQLNRMSLLAKNLGEIKDFDKNMFDDFKTIIINSNNIDNFFGTRFEINIAATLIRCKTPFRKTESPDFSFGDDFSKAAIECTSARIRAERENYNLLYKVESAVKGKSEKEYANRYTALFIDITNLIYNTSIAKENLFQLLDRENYSYFLSDSRFGNLTIFMCVYNINLQRYESRYIRIDHPQIGRELAVALDSNFPRGAIPWDEIAIHEEG